MKKVMFLAVLVTGIFFFNQADAQVKVSVNIGMQPVWGPVGYDHVDYYYLPEYDAYYDVPGHVFVYFDNGAWIRAGALPPRFGHVDLYHSYKVVLNDRDPWLHHEGVRAKYATYRDHHDQVVIRDSHEPKYFEIKEHPEHSKWKGGEHHDEHHEEHDKGHEKH